MLILTRPILGKLKENLLVLIFHAFNHSWRRILFIENLNELLSIVFNFLAS